jgi:multidrug efflux pump
MVVSNVKMKSESFQLSSNVLSEFNANEVVAAIQNEIDQFNAPAGVEY